MTAVVQTASDAAPSLTFADFNLPVEIMSALERMGYQTPTPIQSQSIPMAIEGRDVMASAQTGTGKTAAFSIPMTVRLLENPQAMALVLAPTRELAAQTLDVVRKITAGQRDMKTALLIGGEGMGKQFDQLRQKPRIIIGTPGRINDHLRRNPSMLQKVSFVAIDEADRMLDMGFAPQIDEILENVPKQHQTVMFSATFPENIIRFARKYLNNPERVAVSTAKINAPKIKHEMIRISDSEKYNGLLDQLELRQGSIIVFVKTQHGTERLAKRLDSNDYPSIVIHGGLRQAQRDRAVREFRQQRSRIMIATDVAARGLDIPHIEHVINYDLPQVAEDYIHRIGRTARAGAEGNAMCFVIPSEMGKWNAINRIMNPGAAPERGEKPEGRQRSQRPQGGNGGRNYKNASGFNQNGGKKRNDRPAERGNDVYESRSRGQTEKRSFRDNDFRDRDFRDSDSRSRDTRDTRDPRDTRDARDNQSRSSRPANSYTKKPAQGAPRGRGDYSEGRNYNEGRGNGYEDNSRNDNARNENSRDPFGVQPRRKPKANISGKPVSAKSGKPPAGGKKPFVFKGNSRKPARQGDSRPAAR